MQTLQISENPQIVWGQLFTNLSAIQSTIDNLPKPQKISRPEYYVDNCIVDNGRVLVDYTINDEWAEANLSLTELKNFVLSTGLNEWIFDYSVNGEHVQDSGCVDAENYLEENLRFVVKSYLEAAKVWQNA